MRLASRLFFVIGYKDRMVDGQHRFQQLMEAFDVPGGLSSPRLFPFFPEQTVLLLLTVLTVLMRKSGIKAQGRGVCDEAMTLLFFSSARRPSSPSALPAVPPPSCSSCSKSLLIEALLRC